MKTLDTRIKLRKRYNRYLVQKMPLTLQNLNDLLKEYFI